MVANQSGQDSTDSQHSNISYNDIPDTITASIYLCMSLPDLINTKPFNRTSYLALQRACFKRLKLHFPEYAAEFIFEQNVNWRKELAYTYQSVYAGLSTKATALLCAIKENNIIAINELTDGLEDISQLMPLLLEKGELVRELTYYINTCHQGQLRNFFYTKIASFFINDRGGINTKKRDSHNCTILFWALLLNQSQGTISSLIAAGSHWNEEFRIERYHNKTCLEVCAQANNFSAVDAYLAQYQAPQEQLYQALNEIVKTCLRYGPSNEVLRFVFSLDLWQQFKRSSQFENLVSLVYDDLSSFHFNDETISQLEDQGIDIKGHYSQLSTDAKKRVKSLFEDESSTVGFNQAPEFYRWCYQHGLIEWPHMFFKACYYKQIAQIKSLYCHDLFVNKDYQLALIIVLHLGLIPVIDMLDIADVDIQGIKYEDDSLIKILTETDSRYGLEYLDNNGVVFYRNDEEKQALTSLAIKRESRQALMYLFTVFGSNFNTVNTQGYTVLDEYVNNYDGYLSQLLPFGSWLLEQGARATVEGDAGQQVFNKALKKRIINVVRHMLENGFMAQASHLVLLISSTSWIGTYTLQCLDLLMQYGVNPNLLNEQGKSQLLDKVFSKICSDDGIRQVFVSLFDSQYRYPLVLEPCIFVKMIFKAVARNSPSLLGFFIAQGGDLNAVHDNTTALIFSISKYRVCSLQRSEERQAYFDCVKRLIEAGADVDQQVQLSEYSWNSPLMEAIGDNSLDLVNYLLDEANVEVNQTVGQFTPLTYALENEQWEIAEKLFNVGADVNCLDSRGMSALHVAVLRGCPQPLFERMLIKYDEPNSMDLYDTLLSFACMFNWQPYVSILLEAGFDANAQMPGKQSALVIAAAKSYQLTKLLIEKGAQVAAQAEPHENPLFVAIKKQNPRTIFYLLSFDSSLYQLDKFLQQAEAQDDNDAVELIQEVMRFVNNISPSSTPIPAIASNHSVLFATTTKKPTSNTFMLSRP